MECIPSLLLLLWFSRRVHFDWVPADDVTSHIFASDILDLLVRIPRIKIFFCKMSMSETPINSV